MNETCDPPQEKWVRGAYNNFPWALIKPGIPGTCVKMADNNAQSSSRSTNLSTPVNDQPSSSPISKKEAKTPVSLVKRKKIRETVLAKVRKEDSSSSVTGGTDGVIQLAWESHTRYRRHWTLGRLTCAPYVFLRNSSKKKQPVIVTIRDKVNGGNSVIH